MGRLILFALVILAVVLVWKAFGPGTWDRGGLRRPHHASSFTSATRAEISRRRDALYHPASGAYPEIKGPDDDEEFLWELDKKRFKERRERDREIERRRRQEREREKQQRRPKPGEGQRRDDEPGDGAH